MLLRTRRARKWPHASINIGVSFGMRNAANSHSLEKGAAMIGMHSKGVQVLPHRHSCAAAEFLRISAQQFHAVFVEPLGALDDAAQMFCMGQSIEALEVLSSEPGDNRSPIVITENSLVYHSRFPRGGFKQHRLQMFVSWGTPDKYKNGRYAQAARNVDAGSAFLIV